MAVMSQGFSRAAEFVDKAKRDALKRFRGSAALSKQPAFDQLGEVYDDCRQSGWDGEDAQAIEQDTLRTAWLFIEALPRGYPLPVITGEPDGHINLEWYRQPRRILS